MRYGPYLALPARPQTAWPKAINGPWPRPAPHGWQGAARAGPRRPEAPDGPQAGEQRQWGMPYYRGRGYGAGAWLLLAAAAWAALTLARRAAGGSCRTRDVLGQNARDRHC